MRARRGGTTLWISSFPTVRPRPIPSVFVAQTLSGCTSTQRARRGVRRVRRGGCDGSRVRGARRGSLFSNGRTREGALVGYSESSVVLTDTDAGDVPVWCVDADANCQSWAQAGECDANPGFMRASCMRSCDACAPRRAQRGDGDGPLVFLDVTIQHDADVARYADPSSLSAGGRGRRRRSHRASPVHGHAPEDVRELQAAVCRDARVRVQGRDVPTGHPGFMNQAARRAGRTAVSSAMRTSRRNHGLSCCPWPTRAPTRTTTSSS